MSVSMLRPGRQRVTAAAVGLIVAAGVAACGGDDGPELPPPRSPGPTVTPSPTPSVDPVLAELEAVVVAYVDAEVAVKTEPDPSGEALEGIARPSLIDLSAQEVLRDLQEGRRYDGSIEVVSVRMWDDPRAPEPPHMVVMACLDASTFRLVDIDTGELLGIDPAEHHMAHEVPINLWPTDDGGWEVTSANWATWFHGEPEEWLDEC